MIVRALGLAPAPGLLLLPAALDGSYSSFALQGGWTYVLDQPGALMLAASTLLWIIGGFAASRWLSGRADQARFALWWLLTLSGSLGVFVAGDLVSFYALYALASLPAYGLIAFSGNAEDQRAGRITLGAALSGEGSIICNEAISQQAFNRFVVVGFVGLAQVGGVGVGDSAFVAHPVQRGAGVQTA